MTGLFSLIASMSAVKRYSTLVNIHPESCLEHPTAVCLFALSILEDLKETYIGDDTIYDTVGFTDEDELVLFKSILFHDIDQVAFGDRLNKYALADLGEFIHRMEKTSITTLLNTYGLPSKWFSYWNDAKSGKVGLILVVADNMSVAQKIYKEVKMLGNKYFLLDLPQVEALRKEMTVKSDNFCSKFALDLEQPGINEFIDKMKTYLDAIDNMLSEHLL